jgi:hypothetical protein
VLHDAQRSFTVVPARGPLARNTGGQPFPGAASENAQVIRGGV